MRSTGVKLLVCAVLFSPSVGFLSCGSAFTRSVCLNNRCCLACVCVGACWLVCNVCMES